MQNNTIPDHKSPISWVPEIDLEPSIHGFVRAPKSDTFLKQNPPNLARCMLPYLEAHLYRLASAAALSDRHTHSLQDLSSR